MRILVVEDDPAVRHSIDRVLTRGGHNVLVAAHAGDAWSLLVDFPDPPHIAIVGLVLPGIPGLALADDLVKQYPRIRLVFVTGAMPIPEVAIAKTRGTVLEKPFSRSELAAVVRRRVPSDVR